MRTPFTCASRVPLHIGGTLREYIMQGNQLLARAIIDCHGKPFLIVPDAHRESLLVADVDNRGRVMMLGKCGGKWAYRTLLDDSKLCISSICMLNSDSLSIFDFRSQAVRIYEFV